MKASSGDIKVCMLIAGEELTELKRHTWLMAEAFGLDSRVERYQGKRPIGFYRWDMDCLIDAISVALNDKDAYPSRESSGYMSLNCLHARLKDECQRAFD